MDVELEAFEDGHRPGGTKLPGQLAHYRNKCSPNCFTIFDDLLSDKWCDRAYEYAVRKGRPWGAYTTTADALNEQVDPETLWQLGETERAISLAAVRALLFVRGAGIVGRDRHHIHGTAVWCLSSTTTDEVEYHVDYAELYRYETNLIYPPVYAGTWQVSPINCPQQSTIADSAVRKPSQANMIGGDFCANVRGLDHYKQFGYKGKLAPHSAWEADLKSPDWISVRYRRNRATLHDGDFPHFATKIESIVPIEDGDAVSPRRVILGFNAFPSELAECCSRAPEHSDAFNRTIKLYQTMAGLGLPITAEAAQVKEEVSIERSSVETTRTGSINVKDVMKNPALSKLIIAAARKVKASKEQQETQSGSD